ncbi:uncharacterized protein [Zea mays]|uniref:Uncharacterized protein n=1 Tax=Zea mays TaxID=4577 RepID=A0A1D6KH07_MAIZE|nr:uncharacterized protein LOC103641047 [Zea mays]ONM02357.1 hypothetical protein ZEAMMB73_Zm00001d031228 [Zea mays]|eukprot:XP_008662679.1 uncharacterized protein LOC103641047 [Zea mays]
MAATTTASMMARVDRLDLLLGYLEEMHRNGNGNASPPSATTASSPSTLAAGGVHLISSDDDVDVDSSAGPSTPTWRRPRPAKEVLEEAQAKGSLIDRIASLEHRVLKMEEDMEVTPANTDKASQQPRATMMMSKNDDPSRKKKKKGLKSLVKSCLRHQRQPQTF